RVWLVHHREKRVLNDGDELLLERELLAKTIPFVVKTHPYVLRVPLNNLTYAERLNVVSASVVRIHSGFDRNDSDNTLFKECHCDVLSERSSRLVRVSLHH